MSRVYTFTLCGSPLVTILAAKSLSAVECDSESSLVVEVEAGHGIALVTTILKLMSGKRLIYRPLTGTTETQSVGIARATKGDVTPAGEKFCEILRQTSIQVNEGDTWSS